MCSILLFSPTQFHHPRDIACNVDENVLIITSAYSLSHSAGMSSSGVIGLIKLAPGGGRLSHLPLCYDHNVDYSPPNVAGIESRVKALPGFSGNLC